MRPRIKRAHAPTLTTDKKVRIGGDIYGIASEIDDPSGIIWRTLQLLDGTRTVGQVHADLSDRPSSPSRDVVESLVGQLTKLGFVEDADADPPAGLSDRDLERHERGIALMSWMDRSGETNPWASLRRMREAKVLVLGMGGTGSMVCDALVRAGVGAIHVVEPDLVEVSNLNRQILFRNEDIGASKLDVGLARLRAVAADTEITGESCTIGSADDIATMAQDFDVFALCADSPPEIRSWASRASWRSGVPWVHGGYSGPLATVGLFDPAESDAPCYECVKDTARSQVPADAETWSGDTDGPQAANVVSANLTGIWVAHYVIAALTGVPALPRNESVAFNLVAPRETLVFEAEERRPNCPTCGAEGWGRG